MKDFLKTSLAVVFGIFLYGILISIIWGLLMVNMMFIEKAQAKVAPNSVLVLKLDKPIVDRVNVDNDVFSTLMNKKQPIGLDVIVKSIDAAAKDKNISGIFLHPSLISADWAQTKEIRDALTRFKQSGKFVYAYADYYLQKSYYLASAADKVYLNPEGVFVWRGLSAQVLYYKRMLDKIGIDVELIRHGKYKSAGEPYIKDKMSPENREQYQVFLNSMWNTYLDDVVKSRGLNKDKLNLLADSLSVRLPKDALNYGFVDGLVYYDQFVDTLNHKLGVKKGKFNYITLSKYAANLKSKTSSDKIAIIYAQGQIVDRSTGITQDEIVGNELAAQIRKARKRKDVKAIVMRVNSPGGSALASDIIWREVELAKKEKPFIISMSGVAASGGYYISCAADKIVAQPMTLTGSIGVFGMFPIADKLVHDKIGITVETVKTNDNAELANLMQPMSEEVKDYYRAQIENIYTTFVNRVADGRNMTYEEVDAIAQGRVWTGKDAVKIGLVDTLGGLDVAIDLAAKAANLKKYSFVVYPRKKSFIEVLMNKKQEQIATKAMKEQLGEFYQYVEPLKDVRNYFGIQARLPYVIKY